MAYQALIVDDSRSARLLLGRMLEGFGLTVHAVESAEQALTWLQSARPDVIFMDHLMPGMDGFAAVKIIKADPQTANIPVLMYTSQEGELYLSQARALGAIGVLPKTLKSADVAQVLTQLELITAPKPARATPGKAPTPTAAPANEFISALYDTGAPATSQHSGQPQAAQLAHRIAVELSAELPALKANLEQITRTWRHAMLIMCVLVLSALVVLAWLQWQMHQEWVQWRATVTQSLPAVTTRSAAPDTPTTTAEATTTVIESSAQSSASAASFNKTIVNELVPYGEVPLAAARLERLRALVNAERGQTHASVITAEMFTGDFCLSGSNGVFELASDETPVTQCDLLGNPFADSLGVQQRQSVAFANFINSINNNKGNVVIQVRDGGRKPVVAYPARTDATTAGQWNRAAAVNQRVEFAIMTSETH